MAATTKVTNPVPKYQLKIDGRKISKTVPILSIETHHQIYKVGIATVTLILPHKDGDDQTFQTASKLFNAGNKMEIAAGFSDDSFVVIFSGMVIRHQIQVKGGSTAKAIIHCANQAVKMTLGRKSAYFKGKDSTVIGKVLSQHGVGKKIDSTAYKHKSIVQYQSTDWDFVAMRAEANGLLLYTEGEQVLVKKPNVSGSGVLKASPSQNVLAFDGNIEARYQMKTVQAAAWSPKDQDLTETKSETPKLNKHGKDNDLQKALDNVEDVLQNASNLEKDDLKAWASASLLKSKLSRMQGRVTVMGNAKPKVNTLLEIEGFGSRYNGNALITGVIHSIRNGVWKTIVQYGLSPDWYYEKQNVSVPANGGLLPAIQGLHIGTVKKIDSDKDGEFRVQVDVPMIKKGGDGLWARLTNFYSTSGQGAFFFPEVGDEVVLGFLDNDPRSAIILGSMYSSKNKPAYTPDKKNSKKAITTKAELKIEFDDKDKVITITTPKENKITFSDKDGSIIIADNNKNKVELTSKGISLNSGGDVNIKAKGKINIEASSAISIKTGMGDVAIEGKNIKAKAKMSIGVEGANTEVKGSLKTTIKGKMVMIN